MASRKRAKKAVTKAPKCQQHVPSAAATSAAYTASYMVVQTLSPPLSSPPPPANSAALIHQRSYVPVPPRSGAEYRLANPSSRSERPVHEVGELVDETASSSQNIPEVPRLNNPRTSQTDASSLKGRTQQTTRLLKILIKHKALLHECMAENKGENDEDCRTIMQKISKTVEDNRFRTWRQVKSWTMSHYRRQLKRSPKSRRSAANKRKSSSQIGTLFDHLVPVLNTSEMNMNARKFLGSVIDAVGTNKLAHTFRHRLTREELPDDIGPLVFSPLFLKMCQKHICRVTAARNGGASDSDVTDDNTTTDNDTDDDSIESPQLLPSIELEQGNSDVLETVARPRINKPSTPVAVESPEPESQVPKPRMSRTAQREAASIRVELRRGNEGHSRRRLPSSPCQRPTMIIDSVHQHVPGQVQSWPIVSTRTQEESELPISLSSASSIRPFADFMSPAATERSDSETDSFVQVGSLLRAAREQCNETRIDKENDNYSTTAGDPPQHQNGNTNTNDTTTRKGRKYQRQDLAPSGISGQSQPPGAVISNATLMGRQTPAILVAENQRQSRKLQKPLAPKKIPSRDPLSKKTSPHKARRANGEIRPPLFYSASAGNASSATRLLSEVQSSTLSHPRLESRGAQISKPHKENEGNQVEGYSTGASTTSQQQPGLSRPRYISDDEISLPSVEELCRRLNPRRRSCMAIDDGMCKTTAAKRNKKENRKRQRRETPERENEDPITSFSTTIPKRRKLGVDYSQTSLESTHEPQGVCHDNTLSGRTRRWNSTNDNPNLPLSPRSPKWRSQDGTRAETSSYPKNCKNTKGKQWRFIENTTLRSTSDCFLDASSSSFRSYTEPPVKVKTPFVVPEKHPLSEFSPSIERTNFSVAAHHNPPVKRKRSKSRKLARGRSLCSQPSHDNKGMRSQTVGTVWC